VIYDPWLRSPASFETAFLSLCRDDKNKRVLASMGLPLHGTTANSPPANTPLHAPMLRVNYGKLVTDSVSLREDQPPATKPPVSRALGRLGTTAGTGKPVSRLDSTIARLRGSLGQRVEDRGSERLDPAGGGGGGGGSASSRLSPVERKVSREQEIFGPKVR
jgi:hypothetical protein